MTDDAKTPETETETEGPTLKAPVLETPAAPEPEPAPADEPPPTIEPPPAIDSKDVDEGKAFAILSYALSFIGIPFFLVPLIMRNNVFALFHAKQCLMLWLAGVAVAVASGILAFVCIGFLIAPVGGLTLLVLAIMGLIKAVHGEAVPVPWIGKWGEEWFAGITKV